MTVEARNRTAEEIAFRKYLNGRKILIADSSSTARSGLFKVFTELGADTAQVVLASSFNQALQAIESEKPHIVISEYDLDRRCGLELFQRQRQTRLNETKDSLFVIITGNTSQTAVARAAEEDIDAYIIKPFTKVSVCKTIIKAAVAKIKPSDYYIKIEEGKKLLVAGKIEESEKVFLEAANLDPSPALALYYYGQARYIRKVFEEASGSYKKGLEFNKIHYKCLVGLYELLMTQQKHSEAYDVVKKVSQYFPANPKRLAEVLRLAIVNAKYEDIEKYYQIFTNIDERDETLVKYVCASLIVCGKYYLSTKVGNKRALELFSKAAATGTGRTKILCEIITALLEYGLIADAKKFHGKFPPEACTSDEFMLMRFFITNAESTSKAMIIDQGRALVAKGVADPMLYEIMIRRSIESNMTSAAEDLFRAALQKFPDRKERFEAILPKAQEAKSA